MISSISDLTGFPVDQCKFLISQVIAFCVGISFRHYYKPCPENILKRQLISIVCGVLLGFFCFENQFFHIVFVSLVSYLFLLYLPRKYVHLVVFSFIMSYLSAIHFYFLTYHYGERKFDISSPMMIITQKLTYLAFSYYDGGVSIEKLDQYQKEYALKKVPNFLEFLSFVFNFQSVIIGPSCNYKDYSDYIDGNSILKHQKNQNSNGQYNTDNQSNGYKAHPEIVQPSTKNILFKKFMIAGILLTLFVGLGDLYTMESYLTPQVLNRPLWYRYIYYNLCVFCKRIYYYLAWTIADIVNNASGFGFSGYDENGEAKWDLTINVNIFELETSTSVKYLIDNWHITTSVWLRRIAYDRLPKGKTLGVFVLSAFWHGFYPGYYLTFVLAAFLIYVGRGIRRNIRPYFLKNRLSKLFYDLIGWITTIFSITYTIAPFFYLDVNRSIQFYNSFYWIVQIFVLIFAISLPGQSFKSKPKST